MVSNHDTVHYLAHGTMRDNTACMCPTIAHDIICIGMDIKLCKYHYFLFMTLILSLVDLSCNVSYGHLYHYRHAL